MQSLFLDLLKSQRRRPLVIAHRGDSFHAPENSLEAARLAWEAGADAWELDVQLTRDGVAVVFHDESLTRTTDVAERFRGDPRGRSGFRLADFDWCEVAALDAGSWFVAKPAASARPQRSAPSRSLDGISQGALPIGRVRVPTLVDALSLTADLDWLVNVEIKSFPGIHRGSSRPCWTRSADRYGEPGLALELRSPRHCPDSLPHPSGSIRLYWTSPGEFSSQPLCFVPTPISPRLSDRRLFTRRHSALVPNRSRYRQRPYGRGFVVRCDRRAEVTGDSDPRIHSQ